MHAWRLQQDIELDIEATALLVIAAGQIGKRCRILRRTAECRRTKWLQSIQGDHPW